MAFFQKTRVYTQQVLPEQTGLYRFAGPPKGGGRGDNDPGAHELERGPIEIALSNKRKSLDFGRKKQSKYR